MKALIKILFLYIFCVSCYETEGCTEINACNYDVNADEDDGYSETFVDLDNSTIVVGVPCEDSNQSSITNGTSASANNDYSCSGATYVYRFY